MKSVTMKWAAENATSINLIDVRTPAEFNGKNVPGSKNVPLAGLLMNHSQFLKKGETYYIMCHSGGRSAHAIMALEEQGYNLIQVDGGISSL